MSKEQIGLRWVPAHDCIPGESTVVICTPNWAQNNTLTWKLQAQLPPFEDEAGHKWPGKWMDIPIAQE